MNRLQQLAFWCLLFLALLSGLIGYRYLKNTKEPSVKVEDLLPDSCNVLMVFGDLQEFSNSLNSKSILWQELSQTESMSGFSSHLNLFDSILSNDKVLAENLSGQTLYLAKYRDNFILASIFDNPAELPEFAERFVKATSSKEFIELELQAEGKLMAVSNSKKLLSAFFRKKSNSVAASEKFRQLAAKLKANDNLIYFGNEGVPAHMKNSFSEITIKPDRIVLNGWSFQDTSKFYGDPQAERIVKTEFAASIPLLCTSFEAFSIGDYNKLSPTQDGWWKRVNDSAMFNARSQFLNSLQGQLIIATMPSGHRSLILRTGQAEKIQELIQYMRDTLKNGNMTLMSLVNGGKDFCTSTFSFIDKLDLNYFVFSGDRFVLTATAEDAEVFINSYSNKTSMLDNLAFKAFASKNFDAGFHYLNYAGIDQGITYSRELLSLMSKSDLKLLRKQGSVSYASAHNGAYRQFRLNFTYTQENDGEESNVLWTLALDSSIITKPSLFTNHLNGSNDIAFQTSDLKFNLANATGKLLWSKQLEEQIRSDIFTVDAFKNGKFQLLFNTDHYLHLIDRNGNYVQGYPVRLPAKSTNPLSVFDYEGKKDLRLFIACADKKIYNYSIWGIKQEGFKTLPTFDQVSLPVKYCRVGLSDYLITADISGKIYVFSRKGEGRIDFKNQLIEQADRIDVVAGNSIANTYILYSDPVNHLIEKISLTDVKTVQKLDVAEALPIVYLQDFDNNSISDFIVVNAGRLDVYDMNGHLLFSKPVPEDLKPNEITHYHSQLRNITSIHDKVNRGSIVLLSDQNTFKNYRSTMPVKECDLFNDKRSYFLIVDGNTLKCLKL